MRWINMITVCMKVLLKRRAGHETVSATPDMGIRGGVYTIPRCISTLTKPRIPCPANDYFSVAR
jgi:hypothetical protein